MNSVLLGSPAENIEIHMAFNFSAFGYVFTPAVNCVDLKKLQLAFVYPHSSFCIC